MLSRIFHFLLIVGLATGPLRAQTDPFVGQWKLIRQTDQFKVTKVGANTFAFDFGGGVETIVLDGNQQPASAGTTLSVVADGPTWKVVREKSGRKLLAATWTLSKNGNVLKDDFTAFSQDGSASNAKYLYKRKAAGQGFAGRWAGVIAPLGSDFVLQVHPYGSNGLSFTIPSLTNWIVNANFDGKNARRLNARAVEITRNSKGKITQTRRFELSSDLKTLTMTVDTAGTADPSIYIFVRR
ncbi:MAG TPA: hypothetical protein VFO29_09100 [Candidatus Rubrimentiphilum sp.]|nr:hypothetical protein [Candidatus Rubrimentiphilum sp.]